MLRTSRLTKALGVCAAVTGGAALAAGLAGLGTAAYFMRRIVTPERDQPDDAQVLSVTGATVTFTADEPSTAPGRYGLWLDRGAGHARIGEVITQDDRARTVTRELLGPDSGTLRPGPARWSQYFYAGPPGESLGLPCQEIVVRSEVGALPAWLVPGHGQHAERWAVLVHGRGALREECLRALPVLRELGLTSLVVGYRNDLDAPPSADGRYNLGLSEWQDVEAAIVHALERGATEVVLIGWSMGAAIVLQTLDRSWTSERVSRVVLDSPVIDWGDVIEHQARVNRVPDAIATLGRDLLSGRAGRRLIGVAQPVDVAETNWVARADELTHPMLVIHSEDDDFVPYGPSAALADARPDLVTFEHWKLAGHCREWNVDPVRWESAVRDFCSS
ncbi:alpha/beta hydrolase family protein [Luteipulveratus flavus]|uniref:Alpha/beta hydrolase n=1 Tax=Luteipulveratus flavus TaxID=3031728 RepID=A0ABT6CAE8_9MICO|nr:alpha/beta hydrolase [Luteipulveratus sp. YIM 133296]MDF8265879.1 alpha/beta hydrolase [Luteipulveratus sp. YIM 133296]